MTHQPLSGTVDPLVDRRAAIRGIETEICDRLAMNPSDPIISSLITQRSTWIEELDREHRALMDWAADRISGSDQKALVNEEPAADANQTCGNKRPGRSTP